MEWTDCGSGVDFQELTRGNKNLRSKVLRRETTRQASDSEECQPPPFCSLPEFIPFRDKNQIERLRDPMRQGKDRERLLRWVQSTHEEGNGKLEISRGSLRS